MADHAIDIGARNSRPLRRSLTRVVLVVLSGVLLALPAGAANLVQVRVGKHPTFTRVVFELDAASGYRIERHAEGEGPNTILVTLDAASRARNIASKSVGVETVSVAAGSDQAVARIVTRKKDWPIKEMILANPPRIVLDLMIPGAEQPKPAKAPAPPDSTRPEPEPIIAAVEPAAEPLPDPISPPVIEEPATAPPVEPAPEAEAPVELAGAPIAPTPDEIPAYEPPPAVVEVEEVEVVEEIAEPEPVAEIVEAEALEEAAPAEEPAAAVAEEWPEETEVPPVVAEVEESVPAAAESLTATEPAATDESTGTSFELPSFALPSFEVGTREMIAGGVLALVLLIFLVVRRRGGKQEELDVTAMAEAGEFGDDERIPAGGFSMDSLSDEELPPETIEPAGDSPLAAMEAVTEPRSSAPGAGPGIFDEALEEKEAMDMEKQDLPITHIDPEAPTQLGIGAAGVGGAEPDVARMFQEFERRIAHVEARLDEAVEAREKLERQVSAQNEELRVQRAAIARTQRALRSLNRTDEDQATEPALRDPGQSS